MLKKRNRSVNQDQPKAYPYMSVSDFLLRNDFRNQRARKNSVFNAPGLFVGLSLKGLFECDAAKSPTSPLDYRVLSNVGGRIQDQKCWDVSKVGLRIIDGSNGKAESGTKNIIFGPRTRVRASNMGNNSDACKASKSLPKNYPIFDRSKVESSDEKVKSDSRCIFEIVDEADDSMETELAEVFRCCSLDSSNRRFPPVPSPARKSNLGSSFADKKFCSSNHFNPAPIAGGLKAGGVSHFWTNPDPDLSEFNSAADIELSEDYTDGPNPKTTHIYCDCILGCHSKFPDSKCAEIPTSLAWKDFLSVCYNCSKKLDGADIFMYRGEKAFCCLECRESEILNNEDSDQTGSDSEHSTSNIARS